MTKDEVSVTINEFIADEEIPDNITGWSVVVACDPLWSYVKTDNISVQDFLLPVVHFVQRIKDDAARDNVMSGLIEYLITAVEDYESDGECGILMSASEKKAVN
jgi:hypothetical protein